MKYFEEPPKAAGKPGPSYQRPASYKIPPQALPEQYRGPVEPSIANHYERKSLHSSSIVGNAKPLMEAGQMQLSGGESAPPVSGTKYLMEQISALEDQVRALTMRQNYLAEEERGYRGKLESSFKVVNEQTSLLVNDLVNRVAALDDALKKEETRSTILLEKVIFCIRSIICYAKIAERVRDRK